MPNPVVEALAASTAHGISRIVTSRSIPMKVMWSLLFLLFLCLFIKTAFSLIFRLADNYLTNTYEMEKVAFVFPDLYFCPKTPFSGSYPLSLSQDEAKVVNLEIARLGEIFDTRFNGTRYVDVQSKANMVLNSLPVHLLTGYLAQRKTESIQESVASPTVGPPPRFIIRVWTVPFSHPDNLICFKLQMDKRDLPRLVADNWQINLKLSTDPLFADFNYTGHRIEPITFRGKEVPFQDWSLRCGSERLRESGFTMLIVPPGTYPSLDHETKFHLAPSNSYSVTLRMEETQFSEDLYDSHCTSNHPPVEFSDQLTGKSLNFNYSYAACFYAQRARLMMEKVGCLPYRFPLTWNMKDAPRCMNMSESSVELYNKMQMAKWSSVDENVKQICQSRKPCRFLRYSAGFSFSRWPSIGSSIVSHYAELSAEGGPAQQQLIDMAKQLRYGNHSAHTEGAFRSYVSESLIQVSVSAQNSKSPQVFIAPAYTLTTFLADAGGLLGLYIGCSLLTVCELLELFYRMLTNTCGSKVRLSKQGDALQAAENVDLEHQQNEMKNLDNANQPQTDTMGEY